MNAHRRRDHRRSAAALASAILSLGSVTGCSASARTSGPDLPHPTSNGTVARPTTSDPTSVVPITDPPSTTVPPPPAEQPGWTVESETASAIVVDVRGVVEADGSHVSLARFRVGTVRFDLHTGSTDPPSGGFALPANGGSVVSADERPLLVGAFNGGFKIASGSGGVEIGGVLLSSLRPGLASVVIDASGAASIGVWGRDVPKVGSQVVSVRQNLGLLVDGGQISPSIDVTSAWGRTLGGGVVVARSALGEDPSGNVVYAGSMAARPADLANALVTAGVATAMELDINPAWVQLDLAAAPGGPLSAAVPGQNRPSGQYLLGWSRDFFTVLADTPALGARRAL